MIQFGLSTMKAYTNGLSTGCAVTTNLSGSAAIATGDVWIGGTYVGVSATNINIASGANVNTGTMYIYAYLPANNSTTAALGFATGSSSIVLGWPDVGTAIALLSKGTFGATTGIFASGDLSGITGLRTFGRAMNCSINVTYDQAVARGGPLVFGTDIKMYNGAIEGTLEYADIAISNIAGILGAEWALGGGAGCGTVTLSATDVPLPFMIETKQVTDGVTATWRLLNCRSNSLTLNIDRENYTQPSISFQAIGNQEGDVIKILST